MQNHASETLPTTLISDPSASRTGGAVRTGAEHEIERLREERDLYFTLAALGGESEVEPFLERALEVLVEISGASHGYIEVRDDGAVSSCGSSEGESDVKKWWLARGCTAGEVADIRSAISRSIISDSIASGETVETASARADARFSTRSSIQLRRIDAVLCAPLGIESVFGVVYLQGHVPFEAEDRSRVELFAQLLSPIGQRLIERRTLSGQPDEMADLRRQYRLDGLVGGTPALSAAVRQAMQVAPLDITVLLTGASGTGKSQLARLIHDNSDRSAGPFVDLNCAALPETLIESELFGARAGSHSEARRDCPGKIAAAEGGTLFLDEIGELPVSAQAKLLQLLQSRTYYALGSTRPERADIRIIAATNVDLSRAVRERRFREDLLFRLDVMPIRLPSLAERREDIVPLARDLCRRMGVRHQLPGAELSPRAIRAVLAAEWPGNVRQLANMIEAAAVRAAMEGATSIEARHVFPAGAPEGAGDGQPQTFQAATREFQRKLLEDTLVQADWNVSEAARRLDIARSHVYNLITTFGLSRGGSA